MYEWRDQTLEPGQCDCCGALQGHLQGCLDETITPIRQHEAPAYVGYWIESDALDKSFVVSVGLGIVANIFIWWDALVLLFN